MMGGGGSGRLPRTETTLSTLVMPSIGLLAARGCMKWTKRRPRSCNFDDGVCSEAEEAYAGVFHQGFFGAGHRLQAEKGRVLNERPHEGAAAVLP